MTNDVIESEEPGGGPSWQWLGLLAATIGAIMGLGAIFGFLSASFAPDADPFGLRDALVLGGIVAVALGLAFIAARLGRRLLGGTARIPSRERRSRNILIASGTLGVVIGMIVAATGMVNNSDDPFALLSGSAIPPLAAVALSALLLVVLPLFSWRWHKAIDEHERDAYRYGAVAAAYFFLIGGPVWWLLWRGGLAPEPNGVILYFAFDFIFLIVWFWKKYR